jgi:amino acid transporter
MTALILFVTASSLRGDSRLLRIAAAARAGGFCRLRRYMRQSFPRVAATIGVVTLPFCFFTLGQLVSWLLQVQILLQFIWQCAAVILLRRYRGDINKPFKMWLYPLPALVSLAMWSYIFLSAPRAGILFSVAFLATAVAAYVLFERGRQSGTRTASLGGT